ncbi:hypothetical protein TRFO_27409 [Tritrichomonas foetus]|uniref:Thioredoxin domain-containing protein n=1 Tax=Tritrichomonas foetus TaxID=1144522 RepID=A0A1J4K5L4_9EUKA|nr:hypothetical protein TRFO_27409 [Tritrichomonas foetus]|eukprot:OHT04966.1 hypothetical protein TRFO_27409 [Tritrichomonas foetus]
MIWIFLFGLFNRIFIPYNIVKESYFTQVKWSNLISFLNNSNLTIAYIGNIDHFHPMTSMMNNAAITFGHKISFISLDSSGADKFLQQYNCTGESLFFFIGQKVWLACSTPGTETSFQFMISSFLQQTISSVNNIQTLHSILGHFHFSFITSHENLESVFTLRYKSSPFLGPIDIIIANDIVLNELKITNEKIAIYRQEDHSIEVINISFESIFEAVKPTFRRLVNTDLFDKTKPIAALVVDELSSEMEDFLYHIYLKYKENFIVGWIPPLRHYIVERSTLINVNEQKPFFIAFHAFDRSFYPYSNLITIDLLQKENTQKLPPEFSSHKFTKDLWNEICSFYLMNIIENKINRTYHSSTKPDLLFNESHVNYLVGKNYSDFIKTQKDLIILYYYDDNSEETLNARNELKKVAEFFSNESSLLFGAIEMNQNSVPECFPNFALNYAPHIRLIKTDKTQIPFLHVIKSNEIMRFIAHFSSSNFTIEIPQKDEDEFKKEAAHFVQIMYALPENEREIVKEYFKQMWINLDIDYGVKIDDEEIPMEGIEFIHDEENHSHETTNEL